MYTIVILLAYLILFNQNLFAISDKKASKILDAACIYKPNTTFVFKTVYDSCGNVQTKYRMMHILPKMLDMNPKEIMIIYDYYCNIPEIVKDSLVNQHDNCAPIAEVTSLYDNKKAIQLHPPGEEEYYMSAYFPFPKIKLPVKEGRKSKRGFFSMNDPITIRKILWMKYKLKILPKTQYEYQGKTIEVYETKGKSISHVGEYTASYLFNEKLGFVKWTIVANHDVSMDFTLIDAYSFPLKGISFVPAN